MFVMLVAAVALGATVALLAVLISLAYLKSRETFSNAVMEHALRLLEKQEGEAARAQAMNNLSETVGKLDATVGHLFVMNNRRTVLQRERQVGETEEGKEPGPIVTPPWARPEDMPSPGLQPTSDRSAADQARARAFGEPT